MAPSQWITQHSHLIAPQGHVLDLACGSGRHTRYLLENGYRVTAVDKDLSGARDLQRHPNCNLVETDLEQGNPWPFAEAFDAIVVTNYLYRPGFKNIAIHCKPNGVLVSQTFMSGNEAYGKPSNPNFLLKEYELQNAFIEDFETISFEQGYTDTPKPAVIQSYCGRRRQ
jgi:SAM-dependent methyltransferase